jgi:hypothetical protein
MATSDVKGCLRLELQPTRGHLVGYQVVATTHSADGGSTTATVLQSSDGQAFQSVGTAVTTPSAGDVTIAAAAGIVWVFAGNHTLVTSDDSGATWSRVRTASAAWRRS